MRPEDVLPDTTDAVDLGGTTVRKGSVGAFLRNVAVLVDERAAAADRVVARRDAAALVPALAAVGLFDVFEARDPAVRALVADALAAYRARQ